MYWQATFGYPPDLTHDLFMGEGRVEVLFDDRMAYGDIRLVDLDDPP